MWLGRESRQGDWRATCEPGGPMARRRSIPLGRPVSRPVQWHGVGDTGFAIVRTWVTSGELSLRVVSLRAVSEGCL